ncbi:MAG: hypothetical protein NVSMB25_18020 [Thermoleophilaceae bacterium]
MAAASTLTELPAWALMLLDEVRVGHLGMTDAQGCPRVLPVTFAVHDGHVWTAIDHKRKRVTGRELARVRWLRARPQSTITVDRYDDDWSRLAWVQIVGRTTVVDAGYHDDAIRSLCDRYPQYRTRRPVGPLLRIAPQRFVYWSAA